MKTNAIIRIIIWSLVIVILLGLMGSVLFGFNPRVRGAAAAATEVPLRITSPTEASRMALIRGEQIVYAAPSKNATVISALDSGISVIVDRVETVDDTQWAFLSDPISGWVIMNGGISLEEEWPTNTYAAESGKKYVVEATQVEQIEIEWAAGDILIQPGDVEDITFSEDSVSDPKYAMVWKCMGKKLEILFCEENITSFIGINSMADVSKDLTITVPRGWICEGLEIDAASATVEVNDMTIREVDFDGASGTCAFDNCTVDEFDVDTASGDIRFVGNLDMLDCDAASASVYAVLSNIPSRLDMDTMSGDLDITLPENAGFTVSMDGLSTSFSSDFETTLKNGNHLCGDGSCRIHINAMSGDVTLRKGDTFTAAASQHHEHTEQCQTDPSSCPDAHQHTESCTTDPNSCPDHTTAAHQHSEICTTNPSSCPDGASTTSGEHHAEKGDHH